MFSNKLLIQSSHNNAKCRIVGDGYVLPHPTFLIFFFFYFLIDHNSGTRFNITSSILSIFVLSTEPANCYHNLFTTDRYGRITIKVFRSLVYIEFVKHGGMYIVKFLPRANVVLKPISYPHQSTF